MQIAVRRLAADPDVEEVMVRRFDPRQAPVPVLGLVAPTGTPELAELRRIARRQVGPALEQLAGVAEVRVTGGRDKEVQVILDRYLMEAHGVTISALAARIRAANLDINAGTLEEGQKVFLVRGLSRFHRASDVADVVVHHARDGSGRLVPIKVSDLAKVVLEDREIDHLVRVDGTEGVGLWVYKEAGTNTVAVSRTVRQALDSLGADLPGIEARLVSDEAALVEDAIADVEKAALIGIILAIAVLALFLRSPGPTVVVAVAVPVSLFATLFAMHLGDRTLNLMTLGGLALGAGMLVDNAIVVVESIFRRRAAGDDPATAAAKGTAAVAGAIVASTLTTCIVFLPVLFVRGLAARLVSGISFTVVTSLLVSLAVAVFLIPALASWLLPRGKAHAVDPGSSRIENFVAGLLKAPAIVVLVSIVLVAGAAFMLQRLGTELLPPADPRQFALRLVGPPGQRVEATAEAVSRVEEILLLAAGDDLRATLSEVGRLPEDDRLIREEQTEENTARILVRLAAADESQSPAEADPGAEGIDLSGQGVTTAVTRALGPPSGKSASQVVGAAAPAVADLAGLDVSWEVGTSALSRALGTTGPPIVVEIAGRSLVDLRIAASTLRSALDQEPALWNVRSSFEGGPPELRVMLDRPMADGLGVDLDRVAEVLQAALDGLTVTVMSTGDEERDVTLHLPAVRRHDLLGLPFTTADGRRLAIGDVAHFEPAAGAREIYRRDQRRVARITARLAPGVEYPQALAAAEQAIASAEIPLGLTARLTGEEEERTRTLKELRWAGILAMLLVFMVLAGTFESLIHPLTVLAAVPLAAIGVAVAMTPAGRPLGVMSMLGFIVLAGVAVNDAILLIQAARNLMAEGLERKKALARAAAIRLRPIMMTTATTVLALLPLAIGRGEAAMLRSPLALTIIGGIIASTLGSLLVIPCLYQVLDRSRSSGTS